MQPPIPHEVPLRGLERALGLLRQRGLGAQGVMSRAEQQALVLALRAEERGAEAWAVERLLRYLDARDGAFGGSVTAADLDQGEAWIRAHLLENKDLDGNGYDARELEAFSPTARALLDLGVALSQVPGNNLPRSFTALAGGVGQSVEVQADAFVAVARGQAPPAPVSALEQAALDFLELNTNPEAPAGRVPALSIYRVSSPAGLEVWSSPHSAMGLQTQVQALHGLSGVLQGARGAGRFAELGALVGEVLGGHGVRRFARAAENLAALITPLLHDDVEHAVIDRRLFGRSDELGACSALRTRAFFVDPTPFRGPESWFHLVVWTELQVG